MGVFKDIQTDAINAKIGIGRQAIIISKIVREAVEALGTDQLEQTTQLSAREIAYAYYLAQEIINPAVDVVWIGDLKSLVEKAS